MAGKSDHADDTTETAIPIVVNPRHTASPPEPDPSEPSEERKAELHAAYQEGSDMPYAGVRISTLGELIWICSERGWSVGYPLPQGMVRPNFSMAVLKEATLTGVDLRGAMLAGAIFFRATLTGAHLTGATLTGAHLTRAILTGANLTRATLTGAHLTRATLEDADLTEATLTGANLFQATLTGAHLLRATLEKANLQVARLGDADLREANLGGANLARISLNSETTLDGVRFIGSPPMLRGVRWNGAPLDGVDWSQISRLGDEVAIAKAKTRTDSVQAYSDTARTYHGLIVALEQQGLTEPARRFRIRERLMERRALQARVRTWPAFAFYWLLNLISGQGEAPERILAAYVIIIGSFTGLYWWLSHALVTSSKPLRWYEALVLSLSSFHGRGFFPSQIGLGDPLAMVAAVEAVIGLLIELILIATFSKRFLNS